MKFVILLLFVTFIVCNGLSEQSIVSVDGAESHNTSLNTCGGNCPSNDCRTCICAGGPTYVNIAQICARYSGWNQNCCQCIVRHESSGNVHAQNHNSNGSDDVGVFQINSINWKGCNGGRAPCDTDSNLKCAISIWGARHSFAPWSTCHACGCC